VRRNPFPDAVATPKLLWVSFLDATPEPPARARLAELAAEAERVIVDGREIYAWLPEGVAHSKLGTAMAAPAKPITATARNWRTITTLLSMASPAG